MEPIAWQALMDRLALFSDAANPDVVPVETGYKPIATKPYIFANFIPREYESGLIDPDCGEDYRGILNISVCVPTTWNYAQHAGLASRIANHFAYGAKYYYNDNAVSIYQRSKILGAPRLDGGHNRLEVQVWWRIWG